MKPKPLTLLELIALAGHYRALAKYSTSESAIYNSKQWEYHSEIERIIREREQK